MKKKPKPPRHRRVRAAAGASKPVTVAPLRAVGFHRSVLDRDLVTEISNRVAAAASMRDAFLLCGVAESTGYRWLERGERDASTPETKTIERELWESIQGAKARRRTALKLEIRRAAQGTAKKPGDWRAASALGAITDPEDFVPQVRVHIAGQLDDALDRLKEAFADDPEAYERAVHAIAGGTRSTARRDDAQPPSGEDAAGGEAVHPAPAVPKTEGVP